MIVLRLERAIRAQLGARKAKLIAKINSRFQQQLAITWRHATDRGIISARLPVTVVVVAGKCVSQERPPNSILQGEIAVHFVVVARIKFVVVPAHQRVHSSCIFRTVPQALVPEQIEDSISGSIWISLAIHTGCAVVERVLAGAVVEFLVFLIIGGKEARLKSVRAEDLAEVVFKDQELLVVVPRAHVAQTFAD